MWVPSSGDVAIGVVHGEGQVLGVALDDLAVLERRLGFRLGELVRRLIRNCDIFGIDCIDDAQGGEARPAATTRLGSSRSVGSNASSRMSSVQCPGLMMWSYTMERKRYNQKASCLC